MGRVLGCVVRRGILPGVVPSTEWEAMTDSKEEVWDTGATMKGCRESHSHVVESRSGETLLFVLLADLLSLMCPWPPSLSSSCLMTR